MTKFEERVKHYEAKQEELMKLSSELRKKEQEYKAEMKAEFGICDGEPSNVLSLLYAMKQVIELK